MTHWTSTPGFPARTLSTKGRVYSRPFLTGTRMLIKSRASPRILQGREFGEHLDFPGRKGYTRHAQRPPPGCSGPRRPMIRERLKRALKPEQLEAARRALAPVRRLHGALRQIRGNLAVRAAW